MSTDAPQTPEGAAAAEIVPRKQLLARIKPAIPDWRPAAKRAAGAIAAVAAVGAVLGGLVGFWSTYKVLVGEWLGQKPAVVLQAKTDAPAAFNPPRLSIVVLPFDNLSGDSSQDYFGDGIVENLTTDLSAHVANLLVIARGSAFAYKGQKIDPKQIGRDLNVRYLLQGTVQRSGPQVRLNARLIDAESGEQLWAERIEGEISNIANLQDQIVARIAYSLRFSLVAAGASKAQTRSTPDAIDLILRARAASFEETRLGINPRTQSLEFYRRALALEQSNAEALTGLAVELGRNLTSSRYLPPARQPSAHQVKATIAEMNQLLQEASRTAVISSDAHTARALLYSYDYKFDDAIRELERARMINPNDTFALSTLARSYYLLGVPKKALPIFDSIALRAGGGKGPGYRGHLADWARTYILAGRWSEAIEKAQQAQAVRPEPGVSVILAVAFAQTGNLPEAKQHYEVFRNSWTPAFGQITIKSARSFLRQFSDAPAYLKLMEDSWIASYRKLDVPEE